MAAPTKIEREKREKIKSLGLFVRDSEIYTTTEQNLDNVSRAVLGYRFCDYCVDRVRGIIDINNKKDLLVEEYYVNENQRSSLKELYSLDENMFYTYMGLLYHAHQNDFYNKIFSPFDYKIKTLIYKKDFNIILGEERTNQLFHKDPMDIKFLLDRNMLDENELNKIREYYFNNEQDEDRITPHMTLINRSSTSYNMVNLTSDLAKTTTIKNPDSKFYFEWQTQKTKAVYVELDFTKPIEELVEFILKIKNDFDENPKNIQNIYDLLDDEGEIFKCDLKDCNIYKTNNVKPIGGRLADVLFIYDCKKAGLNNDYILKEINKYWTKTKKLFKDEMQLKTLREYHELAIDYIDNKKYKCYLSGYDIHNKK